MKEITEQQALSRLASECARAEHCTGEMMQKLRLWGIPADASQRIIDYLVSNKYIDDERFARMFVRDKLKFNKWGRRKIADALWQKRIDADIQEATLADISADEYIEVLLPMLKAKAPSIKARTDYEWSMKLIKFAIGRGFDMDVIKQCIAKMGVETDIDD